MLRESFAQNIDVNVPAKTEYLNGFLKQAQSQIFLWIEDERILGFAHLIDGDSGTELRSLGVRPEARGRRLGHALVSHCLAESRRLQRATCELTVAAQNASALGLYTRLGFKPQRALDCYRCAVHSIQKP